MSLEENLSQGLNSEPLLTDKGGKHSSNSNIKIQKYKDTRLLKVFQCNRREKMEDKQTSAGPL